MTMHNVGISALRTVGLILTLSKSLLRQLLLPNTIVSALVTQGRNCQDSKLNPSCLFFFLFHTMKYHSFYRLSHIASKYIPKKPNTRVTQIHVQALDDTCNSNERIKSGQRCKERTKFERVTARRTKDVPNLPGAVCGVAQSQRLDRLSGREAERTSC